MNRPLARRVSALLLCVLFFGGAAVARQQQASPVGTWEYAEGSATLTLKLGGDGAGSLNDDAFRYVIRGDQLLVESAGGEKSVYTFRLEGDALTVSGGNLPRALTFKRRAAGGLFEKNLGAREEGQKGAASPVGEWALSGAPDSRLVLNADGSGTLHGDPFRWTFAGGVLSLTEGKTSLSFNASLDSKTLTLMRASDGRSLVFVRVASGAANAPRAEGRPESAGGGLVGHWKSSSAVVQIKEDGTLTINGQPFRYEVRGNVIVLNGGGGAANIPFQLSGDTLTVVFEGERIVYRRATADEAAGEARAGGANPRELAGKWCYMSNVNATGGGRMSNRCFTLGEDGTYEYYSETSTSATTGGSASQEYDSGTWSISGGNIIANSRSRGRLVIPLELRNHPKTGDPMLVLDGDAYVTYSPRPPWP